MSVPRPEIVWIGTNGHNVSPYAHPTLAVVAHIMEGSLGACDAWFANPSSGASANYGIGKNGTIHCYVDPEHAHPYWAWANGVLNYPDATVQALVAHGRALYGNVSPNVFTVSIEHEGYTGEAVPDAQFQSSAHLTAYLCQQFHVPADRSSLLGHYQFDAVNRPHCPGWTAEFWERYVGRVREWLYAEEVAPPVDPAADLRKYASDAADRCWKAQAEIDAALESLGMPTDIVPREEIEGYLNHARERVEKAQEHLGKALESLTW